MAPPSGPLSPADIMALAIRKGRLDAHLQRLRSGVETVLSDGRASGRSDDMRHLAVGAGYPDAGSGRFGILSSGEDASRRELAAVWDALDLTLLATAPGGPGGESELQVRAWHNLMAEARSLWYRAAIADVLVPEIDDLMARGRAALQSAAGMGGPARDATTFRNQIIENNRRLWAVSERLTSARAEIAVMLNAPSALDIQIRPPDWSYLDIDAATTSLENLEILALAFRKEPGTSVTSAADRAAVARREIEKSGAGRDGKAAGLRLLQGAARTASGPMTDQYVMVQVRLARQALDASLDAWRAARAAVPPDPGSMVPAKSADEDRSRELAISRKGLDRVLARLREYLAHAEGDAALHRLHRTLGLAEIPADDHSGPAIDAAMAQWNRNLTLATAAQGDGHLDVFKANLLRNRQRTIVASASPAAPSSVSPAASSSAPVPLSTAPVSEPASPAGMAQAATPVSAPPPAAIPPRAVQAPAPDPVVISAASAEAKGRFGARTISVYRDVVDIHEGPSRQTPVVGQGLIGEEYRLLGWSPDGWVQIEMVNGAAGWLPTKFVRAEEAAPKPEPPAEKAPKPAVKEVPAKDIPAKDAKAAAPVKPAIAAPVQKAEPAAKEEPPKKEPAAKKPDSLAKPAPAKAPSRLTTTDRANLRGGPGLNYEVKYVAPANTSFEVIRTSDEWFLVRDAKGGEGWLHQSVVNGGR